MSKLFAVTVAVLCVAAAVSVRAANVDADADADADAEVDLSSVVAADTATWQHLSQRQLMRLSVFGNSGCQTIDVAGFDYNKGFAEFCKKYGKVYKSKTYALRFATWKAAYNCIAYKNSNAASLNFFQRPNHLHDHTQAEFLASLGTRTMDAVGTAATAPASNTATIPALTSINGAGTSDGHGAVNPHGEGQAQKFRQIHGNANGNGKIQKQGVLAPESFAELSAAQSTTDPMSGQSFDWRTKGVVNPIGYQRTCGNCWAWTAATVAEAAWKIAGNNLRKVSVQQITDCSPEPCNGCKGGVPGEGLSNVNMFGGFCADSEYPFQGRQTKCNGNCKVVVKLSEVLKNYRPSDENALFEMLKIGPVSVGLVASPSSFMSYGGGVYDDVKCNAADVKINHGMTIVGYGTDPTKGDYWILKNQWATSWGEQGYMRLKRGVNQCKIVTQWVTAKSTLASVFGINDGPAPGAPPTPVAPLSPCQTKPDARGVVIRGTCQDVISCTDNGGSPTAGLCPGAANIQCCLNKASLTPNVTPANTAVPCTARHPTKGVMTGGTCIDAGICNAATNLPVRGACAGAANIQCCLPRQ